MMPRLCQGPLHAENRHRGAVAAGHVQADHEEIVEAAGSTLRDTVRLVVYVTDMNRHRPLVNRIQEESWSGSPYLPRTIVEVEGTFYCPVRRAG